MDFLRQTHEWDEIKCHNLLEHIPDALEFLSLIASRLKNGGRLELVTDNAEFLPFYVPHINMLGFGAHSSGRYRYLGNSRHAEVTEHYHVFTKMHLRNLMRLVGLKVMAINRVTWGARLKLVATNEKS